MDTESSLGWLEENGLTNKVRKNRDIFKRVFKQCLAHDGEKVLMIGDTGSDNKRLSALLSSSYFYAAQKMGVDAQLILRDSVAKPSERTTMQVLNSLKNHGQKNIIVANLSNKFGTLNGLGPSFRAFCKSNDHRFISATSLGYIHDRNLNHVVRALDLDYKKEFKRHTKLRDMMTEAQKIRVTTDAGTDVTFNVKGTKALSADGNYSTPGAGGNMPAGEVYIPPRGRGVNGRIVIDGSTRNKDETLIIKTPITLDVKNGEITKVAGNVEAKALMRTLKWALDKAQYPWGIKRIGELGIGLNRNAQIIGSTVIDEKTFKTAHAAIGSNAWFGGSIYAIIHLDQVFKDPVIEIDDSEINLNKI